MRSFESPFRNAYRQARKHPRTALGAAAGTVAAVIGVTAGVSAAATPAHSTANAPFPAAHAAPVRTDGGTAPATTSPASAPARPAVAHTAASAPATPAHTASAQAAPASHKAAAHQAAPGRATSARQAAAPVRPAAAQHAGHARAGQHPGRPHAQVTARHQGTRSRRAPFRHGPLRPRAAARRAWPYLIYDSVTPSAIPAGHAIATYATGPYAASAAQVAGRKAVLWIDTQGTDPAAAALDVEPGDATPEMAASWAWHRLHADPNAHAIIYTMRSEWAAAQASAGGSPTRPAIRTSCRDPTPRSGTGDQITTSPPRPQVSSRSTG